VAGDLTASHIRDIVSLHALYNDMAKAATMVTIGSNHGSN
jgi:hypothetical protein